MSRFIDLAVWRRSPERVQWMKEQFENPMFKDFFNVLQHRALEVHSPQADVNGDFFHGVSFGKTTMLQTIALCAEPMENPVDVPVTYGVDETDQPKGV